MSGTGFGAPASFIRQRASPACVLPLPAPFVRLRLSSASVFRPSAPFVRLRPSSACVLGRQGTGEGFCHSVPVRRAKMSFSRVQKKVFAILYPSDEQNRAFSGYRKRFLSFCTRPTSKNQLFPGTGSVFCCSVPVRRTEIIFSRVQEMVFAFLYPWRKFLIR